MLVVNSTIYTIKHKRDYILRKRFLKDQYFQGLIATVILIAPWFIPIIEEAKKMRPTWYYPVDLQLVKSVKAGQSVGYGSTATTKVDTKLGVVTMGYADGIPRNANSEAGVLVGNKRAPIIGRVSMDQFVVDLVDFGNNLFY